MNKVYGFITKREFISTVKKNILPGTFVLKIGKPFPGIYKTVNIRNIPEFYFLVLQEKYSPESILEASEYINRICRYGFNAVAGEIMVAGQCYPVIRIKNIQEVECLDELQTLYLERGFKFSIDPVQIDAAGMIKIIKYFSLNPVGEGMYFDDTAEELGYFTIPRSIEWDAFERMTQRIRINVATGSFDAATGIFYLGKKEQDIVRIFNLRRSIGNLEMLKKQYHQAICNPEYTNQGVI